MACSSRSHDQQSLQRDSLLLQFLHGFLTSAPLLIIHLYLLGLDLVEDSLDMTSTTSLVTLGCLFATCSSLLLTIFSYIIFDRLHSEKRRVVFPGHVTAIIWHLCLVAGRVLALTLFAVAYGQYISLVVTVHWIFATVWTFCERTSFCGDMTITPPKKRWCLEIPFVFVVSFVFVFLFFNVRDGSTISRVVIYHVLTSMETLILASLFYINKPNFYLSPWAFAFTVGSYIMGVAFMFLYYAAWHPSRTADCFLLGVPHSCDCCEIFHKRDDETANVDLPLEEGGRNTHDIQLYNIRRDNGEEGGGLEDAGISLTDYDPMTNLSVLTERRSSFTIGQLSRSMEPVNSTPRQVQMSSMRRGSGRSLPFTPTSKSSGNISHQTTSNHGHNNKQVGNMRSEGRTGISPRSSTRTPRNDTGKRIENTGTRPLSMNMVTRSVSDSMRTRPGGGAAAARTRKRPASDNINSFTTSTRHPRQTWFPRSDGYPPYHPSALLGGGKAPPTNPSNFQTAPLPRRHDSWKDHHQESHYNHLPSSTTSRNNSYFSKYPLPLALPSPIGEEPQGSSVNKGENSFTDHGNMFMPPFVLKIDRPRVSPVDRPRVSPRSLEDISRQQQRATEQPPYATVRRNGGVQDPPWSDINYGTTVTGFSPRLGRQRYISTPVQTRRRSLSPIAPNSEPFSRRGSPHSYSASCTPKHSPSFGGRRHRNPSNPLHTHDPMQEFTQLYTTSHSAHNSPKRYRRASSGNCSHLTTQGEDGAPARITSTSSSYLISSDNHSETDTGPEEDKTMGTVGASLFLPNPSCQPVLKSNGIINKSHNSVKVTAYRQNSDEFLVTKLNNINGTLV